MQSTTLSTKIVNGIQLICVLAIAVAVIRHEFFAPEPVSSTRTTLLSDEQWQLATSRGHRFGPANARVTIVEFADFECPACRQLAPALAAVRAQYPSDVAILFRHWPLSYHAQAYPAARAAECAGAQGKFEEFHDAMYRQADLLGKKPYSAFAAEAGVPDTILFDRCAGSKDSVEAVNVDTRDALALNGTGTPMLVINHAQITTGTDSLGLLRLVKDALKHSK